MECNLTQRYIKNTAEYLLESTELPDKSILSVIIRYDAAETLCLRANWPRSFSTELTSCPKCSQQLSPLAKKRQRQQSDKQLLISKLHIIEVEILSRKCKACSIIFNPYTLQHGFLDIGEVTLVTSDIFFIIRASVRQHLFIYRTHKRRV